MTQPELFQDLPAESVPRKLQPPLFPSRFIRVRVAYEDLIFGALAFLLIVLGGFCLGVERGKRLTPEWTAASSAPLLPRESLPVPLEPAAPAQEASGRYAIQLASYLDSQAAQREAVRLRRQGFQAEVVKQGKYFELRVTGYRSKEEARMHLAALRKTYHDGFIKQLSSG